MLSAVWKIEVTTLTSSVIALAGGSPSGHRQPGCMADILDERQTLVTHESLRLSYSIFSVIVLCLLLYLGLRNSGDAMLMLTFAMLLYLAHTLPSSVLAWREREV